MNILNNNRPSNIEPCGIPQLISDHLLYEEPTLFLWFFKLKWSNKKLRLSKSNPYASNFAINKACDKRPYALHKSIQIAPKQSQSMLHGICFLETT